MVLTRKRAPHIRTSASSNIDISLAKILEISKKVKPLVMILHTQVGYQNITTYAQNLKLLLCFAKVKLYGFHNPKTKYFRIFLKTVNLSIYNRVWYKIKVTYISILNF